MARDHRLNRRETLKAGAAIAASAALPATAAAQAPAKLKLRVLETTDLHVNIVPYDYFRDAADDTVGLAKTANLIKAAQAGIDIVEVDEEGTFHNRFGTPNGGSGVQKSMVTIAGIVHEFRLIQRTRGCSALATRHKHLISE